MHLRYRMRRMMKVFHMGAANLRAHKMRSVLTVLGIVFGVCSVISMLSIGEGASQEVQERIRRLGSQNIIVRSMKPVQSNAQSESRNMVVDYGLRYGDAERLSQTLPAVKVTVPIKARTEDLWVGARKVTVQLVATVPWFFHDHPLKIRQGRVLAPLDLDRAQNVCVLASSVATDLFQYHDPIGQVVKIGSDTYRVIGTVDAQRNPSGVSETAELASQNGDCYIPITTARERNGDFMIRRQQGNMSAERVELSELILQVKTPDEVLPTSRLVEDLLARYHEKKDYEVIVPLRLLEEAQRTQRIFSIVLGSIAAISLLVGGIGIMNIMLASVSERTREIGVRRALGARRKDIMNQFLIETLLLSIGGGVIGMGLGAIIPWLVTYFSSLKTVLTPSAFILSFMVSAVVGVVFGLYPARRAAMMDPIEALRYE